MLRDQRRRCDLRDHEAGVEAAVWCEERRQAARQMRIDELLERPTYAQWWGTKLCDVTGHNAPLFLGNTDFGPLVTYCLNYDNNNPLTQNSVGVSLIVPIYCGPGEK